MFKRWSATLVLLIVATVCATPSSAGDDFLKDFMKALEQEAKTSLDQARLAAENTAALDEFDRTISASYLVETRDGRKFQVRNLSIASDQDLTSYAGGAERLSFSRQRGTKYSIRITWPQVETQSDNILAHAFAAAANKQLASEKLSSLTADVKVLSGASLSGQDWTLLVEYNELESIERVP